MSPRIRDLLSMIQEIQIWNTWRGYMRLILPVLWVGGFSIFSFFSNVYTLPMQFILKLMQQQMEHLTYEHHCSNWSDVSGEIICHMSQLFSVKNVLSQQCCRDCKTEWIAPRKIYVFISKRHFAKWFCQVIVYITLSANFIYPVWVILVCHPARMFF